MPTGKKVEAVERLRQTFEKCTIAISTDYTGLTVGAMTDLRRAFRQAGVEFRVIKNSLAYLAADAAERPLVKEIIQGPTAIAFGYADPAAPARVIASFVRDTRSPLAIRGGVLGDRSLTAGDVDRLSKLPSKEELIGRLAGQLKGPVAGLASVLSSPKSGLATVLKRRAEALQA